MSGTSHLDTDHGCHGSFTGGNVGAGVTSLDQVDPASLRFHPLSLAVSSVIVMDIAKQQVSSGTFEHQVPSRSARKFMIMGSLAGSVLISPPLREQSNSNDLKAHKATLFFAMAGVVSCRIMCDQTRHSGHQRLESFPCKNSLLHPGGSMTISCGGSFVLKDGCIKLFKLSGDQAWSEH